MEGGEENDIYNMRRASTTDSLIHINPNRPKTPTPIRSPSRKVLTKNKRNVSPSVQTDIEQNTVLSSDGRESETMFFRSDERTNVRSPSVTYGTMDEENSASDTSPLLGGTQNGNILNDSQSDLDEEEIKTGFFTKENVRKNLLRQVKVLVLIGLAIVCTAYIITCPELTDEFHQMSLKRHTNASVNLTESYMDSSEQNRKVLSLYLKGPFYRHNNETDFDIKVSLAEGLDKKTKDRDKYLSESVTETVTDDKPIFLKVDTTLLNEDNGNTLPFKIEAKKLDSKSGQVKLMFESHSDFCIPVEFSYYFTTDNWREVLCAAIVLVMVYGLIIFDLVHRTLASILGSFAAIAIMSAFGMRPTLEKVITWLDVETLSLLFGMMVIVSIFSETGFFDYCALMAYKLAKGRVWPLITLLCLFSTVVSAFLDNVTTILLLTPVTIRLCEVLNLDPRKILIAEVLFSNIGGTATAIGDPPNVIIISNKAILDKGIDFSLFTGHMVIGIIFATFAGYGLLRFTYRKMKDLENEDPIEISELKHEIDMWRREAHRKVAMTREETVMKTLFLQKATVLENTMVRKMYKMKKHKQKNFNEVLSDLQKKYRITDKPLLLKSGLVLVTVILMFFLHTFVHGMHVGLGWIALMGAIWLMVLADIQELETILHRVEWSTLIFFAALFSMMEALNELGLIQWIADKVKSLVLEVDEHHRLMVAILLILWVAAIASSFIDNIPFTTAMIPVLLQLGDKEKTGVDLFPIVLALAFGACLGGNGTLIGASANVLSAGIAEQHGYGFTFWEFFKVGFPMMIVTNIVAMVYLLICHVWGSWHNSL